MASQKWKTFENNIAKEFSQWLFGDPKVLRRAPCSGGWLKRGADGDIIVSHEREKYEADYFCSIEAKCRAVRSGSKTKDGRRDEWHFEQLLTSPKHPILDWWQQLSESKPVVEDKKYRLLAFSKTSGTSKAYFAMGKPEVKFFADAGAPLRGLPCMSFQRGGCEDPTVDLETLFFFPFRDLLEHVDPSPLKEFWRSRNGDTA